jgi:hypothetical protein
MEAVVVGGGGGGLYQYCASTLIALRLCPSRGRLSIRRVYRKLSGVRVMSFHGRSLQGWLRDVRRVRITCQCTYSHTHTQRCIKEASDWRADYDRSILILIFSYLVGFGF